MGTGKCTEVLVLLPPSSANNAAPKFVRCQRITEAAANAADVTRDEGHAVRVGVRHILYGGHWRLRRTFNGRGRPVQVGRGAGGSISGEVVYMTTPCGKRASGSTWNRDQ
jgi:hypothetical protein